MKLFTKIHTSKKAGSRARTGTLTTPHGTVHTPAFEPVATKGTLKGLTPQHIVQLGAQLSFVNTYHLVTHPGVEIIKNAGGIHEYSGMRRTLMSDSGGFQVFSLARESRKANIRGEEDPMLVKISDSGVQFRSIYDGALIEFSPELSMQYQIDIGADIHMAFDECTYYGATHEYSETSLGRTHDWLQRCLMYRKTHMHQQNTQFLYGVIQGGCYEDLRVKSAKFIHSLPVDGVAVGGVSVGESKKEMRDQVGWVAPYLPDDRPVHLLGVGHIDDILDMVACGIDTFDCVEPSRLARMGILLHISDHADIRDIKWTEIDVTKQKYKNDYTALSHLDTLLGHVPTYSYIYHLFKQKELLAYTIATMHNIYVMERLMERIRTAIEQNII